MLRHAEPRSLRKVTLSPGFAVLTLSDMYGLAHFGPLAGSAFVWALLADFFFAPALALLLEPLGAERPAGRP